MDGQVRAYLAERLAERPSRSLSFRPGPLHRLDRPTSGVIVFSSSLAGARLFSTLLRERRVCKSYLAIVEGGLAAAEIWQDALVRDRDAKKTCTAGPEEGKTALTRVRPLAAAGGCTLLHAEIETGRTHQIRAQAAAHGHPLAGDRKYGARALPGERAGRGGFFLHAWKIELREMPLDVPFPPSFTAPPPPAFQERLCSLFGDSFLLP
jgi:23S rRNA pseudouridine955/2504/2580 synthase